MQLNTEKHIELLLQNVGIIVKKYHDLALITGENYNVFNILGLGTDELSHSKILANLLNVKGSHGQGDLFLKLFIERLLKLPENEQFLKGSPHIEVLKNFNTKSSKVEIEKSIGKVENELGTGGRIDIIVSDDKDFIIIENKIHAIDQPLQLIRYKNFKPRKDTPILYLTLNGNTASNASKNSEKHNLEEKVDYLPISYRSFVIKWLDDCMKNSVDQPVVRETLKQYIVLLKNLTNQSTNNKMGEELSTILEKNYIEFKEILKAKDKVHQLLLDRANNSIQSICETKGYSFDFGMKPDANYAGFNVYSEKLSDLNLKISFEFESGTFYLGFSFVENSKIEESLKEKIFEKFKCDFNNVKKSSSWPAYAIFEGCSNWDQFYLSVHNQNFESLVDDKISLMMTMIEDIQK